MESLGVGEQLYATSPDDRGTQGKRKAAPAEEKVASHGRRHWSCESATRARKRAAPSSPSVLS